uniref:hypothetical protein n=1 Tax=Klebsiella variicola TaxID=244366 RepID=UPI001952ADEC
TFHTARSTAFPQPAPGAAPSPGPMKVEDAKLRSMLGVATVNFKQNEERLTIDKPFIYALRDRLSGLVLVSGYVGSIPAEATQ